MWKRAITNTLLVGQSTIQQQIRTAVLLKRKSEPRLHGKGEPRKTLRSRNYVYELVGNTDLEVQPEIEVILTNFVSGLGNVGDRVKVKPNFAYNKLLLPGLAVYPTEENVEKYKDYKKKDEIQYSSPNALITLNSLQRRTFSIVMNKENPWTLQPQHIKTSLRKVGFIVPESVITMPNFEIKGPDMNLEGKEFYVTITINKTETAKVRCRIHHWSTDLSQKLPYEPEFWKTPGELIQDV